MRMLILGLAVLLCGLAHADIFQWTDADGHHHMSDHPPPADVKVKALQKTVATPAADVQTLRESQDARQRQDAALNDLQNARKQKQEADQKAAAVEKSEDSRVSACNQLKGRQDMLGRGHLFTYDSNGDRHYYSDDEVQEKQQEITALMQQDGCN